MGNFIKKGKVIFLLVLILFITIFGSNVVLIIKINVTESKVEKLYFANYYFVQADTEEVKKRNFKDYMSKDGWEYTESYRGMMMFRKGNLQKEVSVDTLIKI